jgi:hypothetical protein
MSWTQGSPLPSYTQSFAINTANQGQTLMAVPVGGNTLEVSLNQGQDWSLATAQIDPSLNETSFTMITGSSDLSRLVVCSQGGIYLSNDGGASWMFSTPLGHAFVVSDMTAEVLIAFQKTSTVVYVYQRDFSKFFVLLCVHLYRC